MRSQMVCSRKMVQIEQISIPSCHRGVQILFGGLVVLMTIWAWMFVPETKGVPLEQIDSLFAQHWFWKRYLGDYHIMDTADTELVGEVR